MKKILLLSVVASTMIMAGGDIAPVEPVIETPAVVEEASGWDFSGQAVVYYQTTDVQGNGALFEQESAAANLGLQLTAVTNDLFAGIGAGFQLSGLGTLGLEEDVVSGVMQTGDGSLNSGAITQGYLTYGVANTSIKIGRQELPKALSPFAFSEGWTVLKNTFEAALVVNSDLPNTTLVYAFVTNANNHASLSKFDEINVAGDGVHMVSAQNKSVDNLTLTGTFYYAPDMTIDAPGGGDATIIWGDAAYNMDTFNIAVQGGVVSPDGLDDTTAFGAKIAGNFGTFGVSAAYSSVDNGTVAINNLGTGVKTPLYTQALLNQNVIKMDSDTIKIAATAKALGGKFTAYYVTADMGTGAIGSTFGTGDTGAGTYDEAALMYKSKVSENTTVFAAYANQNDDRQVDEAQNFVRFWARYNFN